jgi:hypothetical protein
VAGLSVGNQSHEAQLHSGADPQLSTLLPARRRVTLLVLKLLLDARTAQIAHRLSHAETTLQRIKLC